MRREDMKTKTTIGAVIAAGVAITVGITMFYGNLNDLIKKAIHADIKMQYARRAPVSAMLVPIITAPSVYNVLKDPATAEKRQKLLLERIEAAAQIG
jgi:hypothetical protein